MVDILNPNDIISEHLKLKTISQIDYDNLSIEEKYDAETVYYILDTNTTFLMDHELGEPISSCEERKRPVVKCPHCGASLPIVGEWQKVVKCEWCRSTVIAWEENNGR